MRRSGILLHITSLPSPGGVGALGDTAYGFVDFLKKAGMRVWQVLPVGPTGYGESPYQSLSTHAGNPDMIDISLLIADGLLQADMRAITPGAGADFEHVKKLKQSALRLSFEQSFKRLKNDVAAFTWSHPQIDEFALYMALKNHFGGKRWSDWPDTAIRMREANALDYYKRILGEEIDYHRYQQFLFYSQWARLKAYANKNGVSIFGDMPIYVAEDSADTWANPHVFKLDKDRRPIKVAGVPPDYFSADGQLWGNPLYDWKRLRATGYEWWLNRLRTAGELFDLTRVDHFIGFANYYAIPASARTARYGEWEKAPGRSFFRTVKRAQPHLKIIAEDLGEVNRRVKRLLKYCGYPGMKVLSFGFDGDASNPHFPANISENCVAYTGTHDNDTVMSWWEGASEKTKAFAQANLPKRANIADSMIEAALMSRAETVMLPMQDILHLGGEARMNTPGTVSPKNWRWRMPPGALTDELADALKALNDKYERTGGT